MEPSRVVLKGDANLLSDLYYTPVGHQHHLGYNGRFLPGMCCVHLREIPLKYDTMYLTREI